MENRKYVAMIIVVMIAGFLGGMTSRLMFCGEPAVAQESEPVVVSARSFVFPDAYGNPRLILGTSDDNSPLIGLYDENVTPRAVVSIAEAGEPTMTFSDSAGKLRMVATALENETGAAIEMYDADENVIWSAP